MKTTLTIAFALVAALGAGAASPFRTVIESAVDSNAALRAGATAVEARLMAERADNALDGPEVEFEHLWASGSSDKKWNIGVTQELSYPGIY